MNVLRLRRCTWLAICAMLAMTLLPTVSHALARWTAPAWQGELCHSESTGPATPGTAGVQAQAEGPLALQSTVLPDGRPGLHPEHCPYCAPSAGSLGPAPAALATMRLPDGAAAAPAPHTAPPQRAHAWATAQPRAPPALP